MFRWHFRYFALFIVSVAVLIASPSGQAGQSDVNSLRSKADSGDAVAQYDLGYAYEYGHLDLDKDLKQAAVWFRKSADQGSAAAGNHCRRTKRCADRAARKDRRLVQQLHSVAEQYFR